jgi:hypothetical protein
MDSQRPQNSKPDFPEAFDSDEMEIDVSYEEISPEEQLRIKKRVSEAAPAFEDTSESIVDIWLDDESEIVNVKQQVLLEKKEQIESDFESKSIESESEGLSDDDMPTSSNLDNVEDEVIDENLELETKESEGLSDDDMPTSNNLDNVEDEVIDEDLEVETEESEGLSDDDMFTFSNSDNVEDEVIDENLELETEESEELSDDDMPTSSNSDNVEDRVIDENLELETEESEGLLDDDMPRSSNLDNVEDEVIDENLELETEESENDLITQKKVNSVEKDNNQTNSTNTNQEQLITEISKPETELIADSWLDESENFSSSFAEKNKQHQELSSQIEALEQQKANLLEEIKTLQVQKENAIAKQNQELTNSLISMIEEGTKELKERKNNLLIDLEKLERRKERIEREMRTTFAGTSQDLAVRIQGFKEYLVGSLQDLTTAAERLDFPKPEERSRMPQRESRTTREVKEDRQSRVSSQANSNSQPQFTEQAFADQTRRIRQLLEQYRTQPAYYGSPWQLRRTFEPIHAEKVQEWFFGQGGRGAIKGMGSRLQNILVASAVISILYRLYRDRCRILVLVDTPEKLGEWRRGLQDCLGISRNDFGANRGVVLFESADVLIQRADRLLEDKLLPLIIIDETEELINLGLLRFPLWLAFAEKPQPKSSGYLY